MILVTKIDQIETCIKMSDDDWDDGDCALDNARGQQALQEYLQKPKRQNNNFLEKAGDGPNLSFPISSNDTGKLIGRAGSRINELRKATGCKVIFSHIFFILHGICYCLGIS